MGIEVPPLLNRSSLDSARFGIEVWRGHVSAQQLPDVWQEIVNVRADVAIFRVPAEHIRAMSGYSGPRNSLIHADTLVYYSQDLKHREINALSRPGSSYRIATPEDEAELREVTKSVFASYQNHYHANPVFPADKVLAGYAEWAVNHLRPDRNLMTWVATDQGSIVGFICCGLDSSGISAEIILNGVLSTHVGQGIYADLVRTAQGHFKQAGIEELSVSTQVGNYAVQRVWAREGLRLSHAFDTWHVNAMLTHG
ncbi:hypothetical protein GCM10009552_13430 [Rothia nasimurium]|uniref:GNAT family N-acetyltransferase n=1 Tax=Luteibacter anthropi TaxID=564369 RepID=A0A7X5UE14_9GAMM|nr:GNAT family N-acetyltransferase [Luteibacter anthropi]NII08589.1 GNAT family N-acetyltransferase [Luteibacter anthropi]